MPVPQGGREVVGVHLLRSPAHPPHPGSGPTATLTRERHRRAAADPSKHSRRRCRAAVPLKSSPERLRSHPTPRPASPQGATVGCVAEAVPAQAAEGRRRCRSRVAMHGMRGSALIHSLQSHRLFPFRRGTGLSYFPGCGNSSLLPPWVSPSLTFGCLGSRNHPRARRQNQDLHAAGLPR